MYTFHRIRSPDRLRICGICCIPSPANERIHIERLPIILATNNDDPHHDCCHRLIPTYVYACVNLYTHVYSAMCIYIYTNI